jgi:cytoskeleton protein RodZ
LTAGRATSYHGETYQLGIKNQQSGLPMGSFGERLRREREMRGITLDEISASTKIARRHLESLETDHFDALPGGIFNRGFVRAYARYLGIDEDQAVADYVAVNGEAAPPEESFPVEVQAVPAAPRLNPRRSSLPLVVALIALVAVLAVFWARNRSQPEATDDSAANNTIPATEVPSRRAAPVPSPAASPKPAAAPARTPAPATSRRAEAVRPAPEVASRESTNQPAPPPAPGPTFAVMVEAKGDAWITVRADGKTVSPGRILRAGEQQSVRAGQQIVLTTGNAGGVQISFNGKPLGPIGRAGEVRTLTFTAAGLVQ